MTFRKNPPHFLSLVYSRIDHQWEMKVTIFSSPEHVLSTVSTNPKIDRRHEVVLSNQQIMTILLETYLFYIHFFRFSHRFLKKKSTLCYLMRIFKAKRARQLYFKWSHKKTRKKGKIYSGPRSSKSGNNFWVLCLKRNMVVTGWPH